MPSTYPIRTGSRNLGRSSLIKEKKDVIRVSSSHSSKKRKNVKEFNRATKCLGSNSYMNILL